MVLYSALSVTSLLYAEAMLDPTLSIPRPALVEDTPLKLPLNFKLTEAAARTPGEARLANGQYTAIRMVKYAEKTQCDGCGKPRQARELAIIRNDDFGDEVHIGLDCMEKLYGESADRLRQHASTIRASRRDLLARLKLREARSTEEAVGRVRAMVLEHVPGGEFHMSALQTIDLLMPSKPDQDLLVRLQRLALYHQEWQDAPERAQRRWRALSTHPMLSFQSSRARDAVRQACQAALDSGRHLPEADVHTLNEQLEMAASWSVPFRQLLRPEAFGNAEAYEGALKSALQEYTRTYEPAHVYWRAPFVASPLAIVSLKAREGYTVAAIEPRHIQGFRRNLLEENAYRQGSRCAFVEVGEPRVHLQPARYRRRGNLDTTDENESDLLEPERTYPYVPVAWSLVEHYTPTHRAWNLWGRNALESY